MNTSLSRWVGPSLLAATVVTIVLALLFGTPTSVNAEDRTIGPIPWNGLSVAPRS